jgi:hypothetical protein
MPTPRPLQRFLLVASLAGLVPLVGGPPAAAAACPTQFVRVTVPPAADGRYLLSVATGGTDSAWAVGPGAFTGRSLALHWDGGAWTNTPLPKIAHQSTLIGVTATTDTDVWGTGYAFSSAAATTTRRSSPAGFFTASRSVPFIRPMALHWDGLRWKSYAVPEPRRSRRATLQRTSAAGSDDVWAVGSVERHSRDWQPSTLIEHWDGTEWSVTPSPNVGRHVNQLIGVTAIAADDVWAVGWRGEFFGVQHALIEHWDGSTWSVVPVSFRQDSFIDVSAASATDIWAVGAHHHGASPVAIHWDGASWTPAPLPAEAPGSYLEGLSVRSSSDAYAVGYARDLSTGSGVGLIVHWDGASWTEQSSQKVGIDDELVGVTAGPSGVWAVGSIYGRNRIHGLIETPCE